MALATMAKFELDDQVPLSFTALEGLITFDDQPPAPTEAQYLSEIQQHNKSSFDEVRKLIFPKFGI